ncbi:putative HAD superfamily hydrolase [metagenome]|uniref:Putative HAD superfamily hydrolase n=1 Tax=metagenome TaxID=256318 RepID=A0A2P2C0V4_9ZZZZ
MRPRLVATDLDGTLLRRDGTVSARTREVLAMLDRRGVPVVFVTGRPMRWVEELHDDIGGHGLAICSNGAVLYEVAGRSVQRALPVAPATVLTVAHRLRTGLPGSRFALERVHGFARETDYRSRHVEPAGTPTGTLEDLLDGSTVKLLALHEEMAGDAYWRAVRDLVGDLVDVTWSSTWALVEMSAHGVTKASMLADVCAEQGIDAAEVVAFGDMPNDIAMLHWAGTSYAMADAHPAVVAAATHRAPAHDDDGVAAVLTELFDLP